MDEAERSSLGRDDFERLVEEYADRVYNVALRITGDPTEAEDAMQEAFLSAYQASARFRGEASPKTWLYRIAVNTALMRVRARQSEGYLAELTDEDDIQDWSTSVVELVERTEMQERIAAGIRWLEPDQRAVLVLRDVDGLSTSEAAEMLEISEQALKSRLHRARALLRQYLAEYFRDR